MKLLIRRIELIFKIKVRSRKSNKFCKRAKKVFKMFGEKRNMIDNNKINPFYNQYNYVN